MFFNALTTDFKSMFNILINWVVVFGFFLMTLNPQLQDVQLEFYTYSF